MGLTKCAAGKPKEENRGRKTEGGKPREENRGRKTGEPGQ